MNSAPCLVRSRQGRSARPTRSSAWSGRLSGSGSPWTPRANCCWPLLLAIDVGDRTLAMAQRVVHQVAQVLAPDCAPLFLTDGFREYLTALLTHYGQWVQPPRRQAQGPAPKPRWTPLPALLSAQVVKTVRRRRLVRVSHRVVFGTLEAIHDVLAPHGWHINTAFVERINLSIRQHVAAVGRRVSTLCKGEDGLRQQLALFQTYYNFCIPPRQSTPNATAARADQGDGLGQAVASLYASDERGADGPSVDPA